MTAHTVVVELTDDELEALARLAESENRSLEDVVRMAIQDRVEQSARRAEVRSTLSEIIARDADLLDRLAR